MLLLCSKRHIGRRFWFPEEVWVVNPIGIVVLLYGVVAGGLYWPTALACSSTKSLIEGTLGQCSPWCSVD